jgi:hypothetical protein
MAQARLGSGSDGAGAKFLADNQTWKSVSAAGTYHPFVPCQVVYAASNIAVGTYSIDVTTKGVPADALAVVVHLDGYWTAAGAQNMVVLRYPGEVSALDVTICSPGAYVKPHNSGIVRLSGGTFELVVTVNPVSSVDLEIYGYFK